jgi:hypothetical protein
MSSVYGRVVNTQPVCVLFTVLTLGNVAMWHMFIPFPFNKVGNVKARHETHRSVCALGVRAHPSIAVTPHARLTTLLNGIGINDVRWCLPVACCLCLLPICGHAVIPDAPEHSQTSPIQRQDYRQPVILPTGQAILTQLTTPIATDKNQVNDPIEASLVQDVFIGHRKILPRLTRFYGQIALLDIPLAGRNPILKLVFTAYQLPNGPIRPMQAVVRSNRPDHLLGGELTPGTQPKLVRHGVWGIGYYNQVIMAGPRRLGTPVHLDPGYMMTLLLESPLALDHVTPWVEAWPDPAWPDADTRLKPD